LSKRAGYGEERFERVDFQKKVGEAFEKIFERVNKEKLAIVDINGKNLDEVKDSVSKVLRERL
jgi:dTMP kinase